MPSTTISDKNSIKSLAAVVAVTKDWGIGIEGRLPWHPKRLCLDMASLKFVISHHYKFDKERQEIQFSNVPEGSSNAVIMGRKTWDSIPPKFKPMKDVVNLIVTSDPDSLRSAVNQYPKMIQCVTSIQNAIEMEYQQLFAIGGSKVYEESMLDSACQIVFITRLLRHGTMPCDTFFPVNTLEKHFHMNSSINITEQCYHLLMPSLSGKNAISLSEDKLSVTEDNGNIEYCIEAYIRK